jgi:hypothetical protein
MLTMVIPSYIVDIWIFKILGIFQIFDKKYVLSCN